MLVRCRDFLQHSVLFSCVLTSETTFVSIRIPMNKINIWFSVTKWPTKMRKSRDSSVGIALGFDLDDRGSRVRFPAGAGKFSLHHRVQNGSGAHPASYPMGTRGFSLGVKRPGREADHSPPSSAEVKECAELYLHFPNTSSWRGAQIKKNTGTTSPLHFKFSLCCIG
jgi:hypothetical protein